MKAPCFQWFPKDCDTDENVKAMDDREFGFFIRCLNHSWLNRGLPAALPDLARVMGRGLRYVERLWERVSRCFQPDPQTGRLVNPRQELQRSEDHAFRESRRNAAGVRWHGGVQSTCIARASVMQCPAPAPAPASAPAYAEQPLTSAEIADGVSIGSPLFELSGTDNGNLVNLKARQSVWFSEFWKVYWRKIGKLGAERAFRKACRSEEAWGKIRAALALQKPGMEAKEKEFQPHPATWLNQGRWDDMPEAPVVHMTVAEEHNAAVDREFEVLMKRRAERGQLPRL
jgi:hypothetical protein